MAVDGPARPGESEKERLDRNFTELLGGLRVALPGVQVLFAFLLILPFQARFTEVTDFQEGVYYATLVFTALASVLLIGPSARHRMRFRRDDKAYVVFSANRLAIWGLASLGLAMGGAMVLISDFLFGAGAAIAGGVGTFAAVGWVWFLAPALRRDRTD